MSDFNKFIEASQAHINKENIYFAPTGNEENPAPETNFIPLLDFYNAFDDFKNRYDTIESAGIMAILVSGKKIEPSGPNDTPGLKQKWDSFLPDLQELLMTLSTLADKIEYSYNVSDTNFREED